MKQATRQKARRQNQGSFNDMVVELNAYRKKKLIILDELHKLKNWKVIFYFT
jgi:predicted AAA+ superfamily ATPase